MTAPLSDVAAAMAGHIGDIAEQLIGAAPTARSGPEIRFRPNASLRVWVAGPRAGHWADYDADSAGHGDALDLIAHLRSCSLADAARWAREWVGATPSLPPPRSPPTRAAKRGDGTDDLARQIWREARDPHGTIVEEWLRFRGVTLPDDAPLRFHPNAWRNRDYGARGPAMVALMTDPATGQPTGAHVTYLRPDGRGKAEGQRQRVMLGRAGVVRLSDDTEVTAGVGIAEGIETTLSVISRYGWRPAWAALSALGIERFPVLAGIEALTVFADADDGGAGIGAAQRCAERWTAAGREVTIAAAPAGSDFGDLAQRGVA